MFSYHKNQKDENMLFEQILALYIKVWDATTMINSI